MFINKKTASAIYKLAVALLCGGAVALDLAGSRLSLSVSYTYFMPILFSVVFIMFLSQGLYVLLNKFDLRTSVFVTCKASLIACSLSSAAVYFYFSFSAQLTSRNSLGIVSILYYFVLPLLLLLDWALFDRKGVMKAAVIPASVGVAAVYFGFLYYKAQITSYGNTGIPYPFIDYSLLPRDKFIARMICIALTFVLTAAIIYGVDRILGELEHRRCCRLQGKNV